MEARVKLFCSGLWIPHTSEHVGAANDLTNWASQIYKMMSKAKSLNYKTKDFMPKAKIKDLASKANGLISWERSHGSSILSLFVVLWM